MLQSVFTTNREACCGVTHHVPNLLLCTYYRVRTLVARLGFFPSTVNMLEQIVRVKYNPTTLEPRREKIYGESWN